MDYMKDVMTSYGIPPLPKITAEAMAYIPFQQKGTDIYTAIKGFEAGTMYPVLDKPWYGGKCEGGKK
ncbi:MAG: spore coat associated protein CotJA [Ruminococcus sp.]